MPWFRRLSLLRSIVLLIASLSLSAVEPWFGAECDHQLEATLAGGVRVNAESAGRLPFAALDTGAAVTVRRYAYDQKGSIVWRRLPALPAIGTLALAFRTDAGVANGRPLARLAGGGLIVELTLDSSGLPRLRVQDGDGHGGLIEGGTPVVAGTWTEVVAQWDLPAGRISLASGGQLQSAAIPAIAGAPSGPSELWLGSTSLDNFTGEAAEGSFDWIRIVPGADTTALEAARTPPVVSTTAIVAVNETPLSPQAPDATELQRWDLAGAARERTTSGDRICLNGTWRFLPVPGPGQRPAADQAWLRTRLPGRWIANRIFPVTDAAGQEVTEFAGKPLTQHFHGWLVRRVKVPADFRGQRLLVACDLISADLARFHRDGRLVGEFTTASNAERASLRRQEVDLGPVRPGEDFELAVELGFRPYTDRWTATDASLVDLALEGRGECRTLAAIVRPDAEGRGEALITLANPDGAVRTVSVVVRLSDWDGAVQREVPAGTVTFAAGERLRELRTDIPWDGLRRWSPESPALYRQQVVLRDATGAILDESFPTTCGMRHFHLASDGFHLDGVRRRIVYDSSADELWGRYALDCALDPMAVRSQVAELKAAGYNTIKVDIDWTGGNSLSRTPYAIPQVLSAADEVGMLVVLGAPPLERGDDPVAYRRLVRDFVRAWGGHPSVVMYLGTFNTCWYPLGQHPQSPLMPDYQPPGKADHRARALACEQALLAEDPARPVYHNASGNLTPLFTTMHYLSFGMPLQEREDWPSAWSATKPNVLFPSEIGLPYFEQFKDFDFPERDHGPLLTVEHAARYLGDAAYGLVRTPSLRDTVIAQPHDGDQPRPEVMAIKALVASRTLTAWRAWGMPGIGLFGEKTFAYVADHQNRLRPLTWAEDRTWGIKPGRLHQEHRRRLLDRPTPYRDALRHALRPVVVTIGGPGSPTAKDHAWFAGETIAKEAVVINDGIVPLDLRLTATLADGNGGALVTWSGEATVAAGAVLRQPFTLTAPAVDGRRDLHLSLTARSTVGVEIGSGSLPVEVFPAHRPPGDLGVQVALYDPHGHTADLLRRAGVPFHAVGDVAEMRATRVLVVGRACLGDQPDPLLAQVEKAGLIEAGLTVLVFEQGPSICANLIHHSSRQRHAFVRAPAHPALAGLGDADLHDWRGASAMVPATSPVTPEMEVSPHYPHVKYLVTGDGIVAGWSMLRPDRGGFRTLVDAGFDQRESLLVEQRRGAGRILFCQLEVTSRYGSDPAATRLADNLLRWAAIPAPAVAMARRAVLAGDGPWAGEVAEAFPALARVATPDAIPADADLAVLAPASPTAVWQEAARQVLARSGTVVWLHPGGAADLAGINPGLASTEVETWRAVPTAALPPGIAPSELHWRDPRPLVAFGGATPWCEPAVLAEARAGDGRIVLVGLPPSAFAPKPYTFQTGQPYISFIDLEMRRKPLRLVERLLTDAGAPSLAIPVFAGPYGEDGTIGGLRGQIDLPRWRFSTDPGNRGETDGWNAPGLDDAAWKELSAGKSWEQQDVTEAAIAGHRYHDPTMGPSGTRYMPYDGHAWYRCSVRIPAAWRDGEVHLVLGTVDDTDRAYLDGHLIGMTDGKTPKHWDALRDYLLPPEQIRFGEPQTIAIKVFDLHGDGGLRKLPVRLEVRPRDRATLSPYVPWRPRYDPDAYHNW